MTLAAIFDLDGTLVDSAAICAAILNAMLTERGAPAVLARAEVVPQLSAGGPQMVAALLGVYCGDPARDIAAFRARYAAMQTPADSLYPEVRSGLNVLHRRGVRLGICSNKPQNLCEKVLGDLELASLFVTIVGGRPALPPKPAPDLLFQAMRQMGAAPASTRFVGDSALDGACARAAGVAFLGVAYGYDALDTPECHARFGDVVDALLQGAGAPAGAVAA